ncbi:hypothetical protein OXPF_30610 [Oxobacter pfennigii]|uniref:NfeD-like C-terminal domain-containing protein n=1 Tax=Oxobacter pfennigii TaxID=36849 RepID=A0A0P8W749_9CLOT|nr:hypothetical protein [Oxobacter pfennigii]KPU43620.1 hypothetical protein OXPF_30610 [Oxobacter pfennigii]
MVEWWNSIPGDQRVYWYIGIPFTTLFIIQTLLPFLGLGDHGDFGDSNENLGDIHEYLDSDGFQDYTFDDVSSPFRLLTMRNFIVFFTVFSWTGIVLDKFNMNKILEVLLSCGAGFIVSLIISSLFYFIANLTEYGGMDLKNAINAKGEVYLTIPGAKDGVGKVTVIVQGTSRELDAMTNGKTIPTGERVKVIGVIDNQILLVENLVEDHID